MTRHFVIDAGRYMDEFGVLEDVWLGDRSSRH